MARMSTPRSAEGAFGTKLKEAREARGVTLRQIADRTKLSMVTLEALERNDISRLPGGIFTRAFVRSYAAEIGLDPERTVREFIEEFPHDWVTAGSAHMRQDSDGRASELRRRALALAGGGVIIVAALAGGWLVWSGAADSAGGTGVAPAGPPASAVAPMVFEIMAALPLTVEVSVDGAQSEVHDVVAGERLVLSVEHEVVLNASDGGSLRLSIDGQSVAPIGLPGEAASVRIDRDNVESFLAVR